VAQSSRVCGPTRYVVIAADDFGRSSSVNDAVARACDWGFLTAAGIMAGGEAFEEAVDVAGKYPNLSVGLHVTLSDGSPVLPADDIPDILDKEGRFEKSPMKAGVEYWRLRNRVGGQIEAEVKAQFDRLEEKGIHPTHVDCHHHLHMHPLLFAIIAGEAARRGVGWIRLPREPRSLPVRSGSSCCSTKTFLVRMVLRILAERNLRVALRHGLRVVNNVFGLSGTGRMHEEYVLALLPHVRGATNEIYFHPDLGSRPGREETGAVTSWKVRGRLRALGLRPVGFRELDALLPCVGWETDFFANGTR